MRMKEEYVEGTFEAPTIIEETVPDQLKGALGQAASTTQQLPLPIRDAISSGLKIPLSTWIAFLFQRINLSWMLLLREVAKILFSLNF